MVPNPSTATPASASSTDCVTWLNDGPQLFEWANTATTALALDTEFVRERTYWPRLALVQLACQDRDALIDPLGFSELSDLGQTLTRPGQTVLLHSGSEDLIALRPLLPGPITGLYDTQIAATYAGLGVGLGYQALIGQLLDVHLEKQETRSDWLTRPLSERQIQYARDDVRFLGTAHARIDERLRQRGYREWMLEDCQRLAEQQYAAEPDPQPQLAFRGLWRWSPVAQAQLRRALHWREESARQRDLPRRWVLDDDTAIAAAIAPEHGAARLAVRLETGSSGRRRSLQELIDLLQRMPSEEEIATTQLIPPPLGGELKQVVKRMKEQIDALAARLDLPASLICPRRVMDAIARGENHLPELDGWRGEWLRPLFENYSLIAQQRSTQA